MANFDLPFGVRVAGNDPIDKDRYIATDIAQRDVIVDNGRGHEGLQCYVEADKTLYILKGLTNLDWTPIEVGEGGTVIDILYEDLEDLWALAAMVPGQSYKITNFKTSWTVDAEGYQWSGDDAIVAKYAWPTQFEPLIVTADSPTTLKQTASSETYPTHQILYDPDFGNATYGAEAQVYTGVITWRKDPSPMLECKFDYIGIYSPRYAVTTSNEYDAGTTYGKKSRVKITNGTGDGLYISLRPDNIGNDPESSPEWWMIFRPQGPDTTGLYRDYISAGFSIIEDGTFGWDVDLNNFEIFPTFCFSTNIVESSGSTGVSSEETYNYFFVGEYNNIFMATGNAGYFGNYHGKIEHGFGNTIVTRYFYGFTVIGQSYGPGFINNYIFGYVLGVAFKCPRQFENNYFEGMSYIYEVGPTINNIHIRENAARNDVSEGARGMNSLSKVSLSSNLLYSSENLWLHGDGVGGVALINCVQTGRIINNDLIVLEDSYLRGEIRSCVIETNGYYSGSLGVNPDNVFEGDIEGCHITDISGCNILGNLTDVDAKRWKGVEIPANVNFTKCDFTPLTRWMGFNVWSGNPLTLNDKVISKRYSDSTGAPTLEKLWYEETDINGVTNLIEIE